VALKDPMSGFFALRRDVFEKSRSRLRPRGYKILLEILVRARVPADRVREFPYVFKDRRQGYSKLSPGVAGAFVRQLLGLAADRWRNR
jgi:dolichol-phosphate mannosyltransferase